MEEAAVAAAIHDLGASMPAHRLVITGGEPLLQGAALAKMLALLADRHEGWHVEIETNGSVPLHPALDPYVHQFNVSPKLAHSGNPADLALPPAQLDAWTQDQRAIFKFVIAAPDQVEQVHALARVHAIAPHRIWLMPEGRDPATLRERMLWLADICLHNGYALTDRLHIHLYGDTRGT
jgi:organic radical activating enzyme